MNDAPKTFHAPAERISNEKLLPLAQSLQGNRVVQALLDGYPDIAALLNKERQIVACNRALLELLGTAHYASVVGQRMGELLGCVHAVESTEGCGTAEACKACGAVNAVLECQRTGTRTKAECRLSTGSVPNPDAWDLEVVATPFDIDGEQLTIVTARNIAAIKRHQVLERLFFHDTLNLAEGIHRLAELLENEGTFDPQVHPPRLHSMSHQLIEQIGAQRDLSAAERGELTVSWSTVFTSDLFDDLRATYETHPVARERSIEFAPVQVAVFQSDRILLSRVLGNLIKNALEASYPGGLVTVICKRANNDQVRFSVHNETVIPHDVQMQVFKRSFSTKEGVGRGLGTFSARLLSTQYLRGRVDFRSAHGRGTTFHVTLPIRQTAEWQPPYSPSTRSNQNVMLAGKRVLLAEDGPDNQKLITYMLKKAGAEVTVVENGQLALDTALAAFSDGRAFDAILMDMQMPVLDGYAATSKLREQKYTGPIIAVTAHAMSSDREKCLSAGCDGYVRKPINREKLIEIIKRFAKKQVLVTQAASGNTP